MPRRRIAQQHSKNLPLVPLQLFAVSTSSHIVIFTIAAISRYWSVTSMAPAPRVASHPARAPRTPPSASKVVARIGSRFNLAAVPWAVCLAVTLTALRATVLFNELLMEALYPQRPNADLIQGLAIGSIVGQLIWVAIVIVAGLLEPGYSVVRDAVSVLGARDAAHPWLFDTAVAIWGISLILASAALALDAKRSRRGRLGPGLIALTGLAQILDGFPFPADCRWTMDAGCRARELAGELSWQHYAHGITYFFGAIALMLSVFAMAWRFHGDERWGRFDRFALVGGVLGTLIVGGLFLLGSNEPGGDYGLVQRFALAAAGFWILVLAVGLLVIYGSSGRLSALVPATRPAHRTDT